MHLSRDAVRTAVQSLARFGWAKIGGRSNKREVIPTVPESVDQARAWRVKDNRSRMPFAGEGLMKLALDVTVDSDDSQDNARLWQLQNPDTGQYLEVDRLYPKLQCGFEYMGIQHFKTTEALSGEEELAETQKRDEMKAEMCRTHRITLVTITEDDLSIDGVLAKLPAGLPKTYVDRDSLLIKTIDSMCGEYVAGCRRARAREEARKKRETKS